MKVVPLAPAANAEEIQALLDDIVEVVDTGKVVALSFAAVRRDGSIDTGWNGTRIAEMLGSIERLKHRINVKMDEG